jgi:hypothetical protein
MAFQLTSSNIALRSVSNAHGGNYTFLTASSTTESGAQHISYLLLDTFLENSNGKLQPVPGGAFGNFTASCKSIVLGPDHKTLNVSAQTLAGTWVQSSFDLSTSVSNLNGFLVWVH